MAHASPITGGVWATCSISAVLSDPTRAFGHGGSGGSFGFVDLENRIGYAYVMNHFDATKANADPRSVALSDEIYAALGVKV